MHVLSLFIMGLKSVDEGGDEGSGCRVKNLAEWKKIRHIMDVRRVYSFGDDYTFS